MKIKLDEESKLIIAKDHPEEEFLVKKQKISEPIQQYIEVENENESEEQEIMYEVEGCSDDPPDPDEKVEYIYVQNVKEDSEPKESELSPSKEEKFISAVYPQFKGKTKLQLIDCILDLRRQNELLNEKVKTYESTIHKLL